MAVTNNTMILRRELLTRIVKLLNDNTLEENIDRIPYLMRPKGSAEVSRCCIYKDRAMLKYRAMGVLGFGIDEEEDEMTSLADYARMAFARDHVSENPLSVMTDACSACVKVNYVVTNMCRGCVARPCEVNCNKGAIHFVNGQANIDSSQCVNCGLCMKNCPFHAIVYIPVPCEESCPVGAISKDEHGKEHIDPEKCIYCGRCLSACPFGAVVEKSHLVELFKAFRSPRPVVALVAPAVAGQFKTSLENIIGSIRKLGFDDVIEVAKGADVTTKNEAAEFAERVLEQGAPFMTTSCCPSYYRLAHKHIPEVAQFVSHTRSPMYYAAEIARRQYPDATIVFVGPCVAKRKEAYYDPNVDLMLSFEELGTMFVAMGVDAFTNGTAVALDEDIMPSSRGYAASEGVMGAVAAALPEECKDRIKPVVINGIDRQAIKDLRSYAKSCPGNMVEVMACEGGCVNGCNVIANPKVAARQVKELAK
ncbi:monomeric [FeFe] hydrogenase [uncultured Rikenella sp.]|uniref:monomeric [FeFe] hydrogenase n=1 Tax=uncultured Rikenella sp. TaxID=368003 RepID=UPI0026242FED|nr:monomeric [FeFe] hydrogenase [uncultured Rikenella sp.]